MASEDLASLLRELEQNISNQNHKNSNALLSRAKLALLRSNALVPTPTLSPNVLQMAQTVLEFGALISIRLQDPEAFTRYFQQLQPFYNASASQGQRSKITGLYLLLLLSQGDYAGFHTLLESLEVVAGQPQADGKTKSLDEDQFIQYAVRLEQWLMEGSYDRVWEETKSERVPSEEFAIFSDVSLLCPADLESFGMSLTQHLLDSYWHHSVRGGLVLGKGVLFDTRDECEEFAIPRQRGQRGRIFPAARLAHGRQPCLLPSA